MNKIEDIKSRITLNQEYMAALILLGGKIAETRDEIRELQKGLAAIEKAEKIHADLPLLQVLVHRRKLSWASKRQSHEI